MLEHEIAAIYYLIASVVNATHYFEEIPEDMLIPCVFYPTPEPSGMGYSLSTYVTEFVIYVMFMDSTTMGAYEMASRALQAMMKQKNKIQLVNDQGNVSGKNFRINYPVVKKIDSCVYQIEISWKRYTSYNQEIATSAKEIFFNSKPIDSK